MSSSTYFQPMTSAEAVEVVKRANAAGFLQVKVCTGRSEGHEYPYVQAYDFDGRSYQWLTAQEFEAEQPAPNGWACVEGDAEEPSAEQSNALTHYIATREEVIGLADDLRYGSEMERREASEKISGARVAYYLAEREADRCGVLQIGRSMFR